MCDVKKYSDIYKEIAKLNLKDTFVSGNLKPSNLGS